MDVFDQKIALWSKNINNEEIYKEISNELKKKLNANYTRKLTQNCLIWINSRTAFKPKIVGVVKSIFDSSSPTEKQFCLTVIYNYIIRPENDPENSLEFLPIVRIDEPIKPQFYKLYSITTYYMIVLTEKCNKVHQKNIDVFASNLRWILDYTIASHQEFFLEVENFCGGKYAIIYRVKKIFSTQQLIKFLKDSLEKPFKNLQNVESGKCFSIFLKLLGALSLRKPEFLELAKSLVEALKNAFSDRHIQDCLELLINFFDYSLTKSPEIAESCIKKIFKHLKKFNDDPNLPDNEQVQETIILVSRSLGSAKNFKEFDVTATFALTYVNFCNAIMKIIRKCPDREAVVCDLCAVVKRHLTNEVQNTVMSLYSQTIVKGEVNSFLARMIWENIKYKFTILEDLKCPKKPTLQNDSIIQLFNTLLKYTSKAESAETCIEIVKNSINLLIKFIPQMKDCCVTMADLESTTHRLIDRLSDTKFYQEKINARGSQILFQLSNGQDKLASDSIFFLRKFMKADSQNQKTVYDELTSPNFQNYKFTENFDQSSCILSEMLSIFRYTNDNDVNLVLFKKLLKVSFDPLTLGRAMILLSDDNLEKIDEKVVLKIKSNLLKVPVNESNNVEIKSVLSLIYYHLYMREMNATKIKLKSIYEDGKNVEDVARDYTINHEFRQIQNLLKCLKFFQKLTDIMEAIGKESFARIYSGRKFIRMIENVATHFYFRNLLDQSMSGVKVMMKLAEMQNVEIGIITASSLLLTLNYYKLKTETIENLESFIETFASCDVNRQSHILSFLLNLTMYYSTLGDKENCEKTYRKFQKLMAIFEQNKSDVEGYLVPIRSKYYFCMFTIVTNNLDLLQENPVIFMKYSMQEIMKIQQITTDFSIQIQIMLYVMASKSFSFYMDRICRTGEIECILKTLNSFAVKNGYIIKLLDILTKQSLYKLQSENVDEAKVFLHQLELFLDTSDEGLLSVISPMAHKVEAFSKVFDLGAVGGMKIESIRKEAVKEDVVEMEVIDDSHRFSNGEILEKLKKYIHTEDCHCNHCDFFITKFRLFQIGCLYSNLMFLKERYEICEAFGKLALKRFDSVFNKLKKDTKGMEDIMNYSSEIITFVSHWLFRTFDAILKLNKFEECKVYLKQVEELLRTNMMTTHPLAQLLVCKKKFFEIQITKNVEKIEKLKMSNENCLSFREFNNRRTIKITKSTRVADLKVIVAASSSEADKLKKTPTPVYLTPNNQNSQGKLHKVILKMGLQNETNQLEKSPEILTPKESQIILPKAAVEIIDLTKSESETKIDSQSAAKSVTTVRKTRIALQKPTKKAENQTESKDLLRIVTRSRSKSPQIAVSNEEEVKKNEIAKKPEKVKSLALKKTAKKTESEADNRILLMGTGIVTRSRSKSPLEVKNDEEKVETKKLSKPTKRTETKIPQLADKEKPRYGEIEKKPKNPLIRQESKSKATKSEASVTKTPSTTKTIKKREEEQPTPSTSGRMRKPTENSEPKPKATRVVKKKVAVYED